MTSITAQRRAVALEVATTAAELARRVAERMQELSLGADVAFTDCDDEPTQLDGAPVIVRTVVARGGIRRPLPHRASASSKCAPKRAIG